MSTNRSQEDFKRARRLEGKVALVTGSGAGIGRAIALRLAREGAQVMVNDINRASYASGEATVKMIKNAGGEARFILADVSKETDAEEMVKATVQTYGKLDILVNNAGIWLSKLLTEVSGEEWDRLMSINLKGVFLCSKYAIPEMSARGSGVIINLSSTGGLAGASQATAYCASKGGVLLLTKAMSVELRPLNIRVNALCPSRIDTDMGRQVTKERSAAGLPLSPQGKAEDVAEAALFLASDEAAFITGHGLVIGAVGAMPIQA